jgi:hypothetical protein
MTFYRGRATPQDPWLNDTRRERAEEWLKLEWEVEAAEGNPSDQLTWRTWEPIRTSRP